MDGIIFVLFLIFFVFPFFKKAKKKQPRAKTPYKKPSSNYIKPGAAANPWQSSAGHSAARKNTHNRMHSRDGDAQVFPDEHLANVRKRDLRDRLERARMEKTIHGKQNKGITKASNQGRSDWGARGDSAVSGIPLLLLLFFALLAYLFYAANPNLFR